MSPRRMPLPRAHRYHFPLDLPPAPLAPQHRATIGPHTLHAALTAHAGHEHGGALPPACPTCTRYLAALHTATATATAPQPPTDPTP